MDREFFYKESQGTGDLDYERYLNTSGLLSLQKPFEELCNADELQFMIIHQVEELWMKLIMYTLLDIDDYIAQKNTLRVVTLFSRVHRIQRMMIQQLDILETMSPKEYQEIRLQLGNGSGQESPGFKILRKMPQKIWDSFESQYLKSSGLTVADIYHHKYNHDEAYVVAEAMVEFDELFQKFLYHHILLIRRSIGLEAKSLKGRSVSLLEKGLKMRFFPKLWDVRSWMTDEWGGEYGEVRQSLSEIESSGH
ncbi:MAG: tryptophan 2,3-dioxygenase [Waddliaceae bacterium]|nr:tryptophan 2,3-dioxygenase [Waddliaceae bacterium]